MMILQTHIPEKLHAFVKSFWFLEVENNGLPYEEAIIPDGHHEIIFHLHEQVAMRKTAAAPWKAEPACFIAGQTTHAYKLQLMPGSKLYGIRFYPHTLFALLHTPMVHFTNEVYSLQDVLKDQGFWNCIEEDPQKTFASFEKLLLEKLAPAGNTVGSAYIDFSVNRLLENKGNIAIDELTRKLGISAKYLNTLFKKYVGVSPKTMSCILRFNHFIDYKARHPQKSFTECGYETGYFDQSHLIRSCYDFTGQSPSAYFKQHGFINEAFAAL